MPAWVFIIIVFLVIDFALIVFVYFKKIRGKKFAEVELNYIRAQWIRILDSFESHTKDAIMDADKLLDYALGKKGFAGNLGEKLKKAGSRFSDLNGVWDAHKLRNRIAHELNDLDRNHAKKALKHFKNALNDLGAKL